MSQCTQGIAHIRQDIEVAALLGSRISVTKFLESSMELVDRSQTVVTAMSRSHHDVSTDVQPLFTFCSPGRQPFIHLLRH